MDYRTRPARLVASCFLVGLMALGCSGYSDKPDVPTVDSFTGRLTHKGEPVSFPEDTKVRLDLIRVAAADTWGIPIAADGTFDIGWMPIGKYVGQLKTTKATTGGRGGAPSIHSVPEFEIREGQTEYTVELGENWKPPEKGT